MSAPTGPIINFKQIKTNLHNHSLMWIVPTIVCTALGLSYAMVKSTKWKATQAAIIRNIGNDNGQQAQGQFATPELLKAAQESVVNAARNPNVVEATLREMRPAGNTDPNWPSKSDVESMIPKITVAPQKGSEFGKSDAIYISTEARTAEQAEAFTAVLVKQIERKLQANRAEKAKSLIAEYTQTKAVALEKTERGYSQARKDGKRSRSGYWRLASLARR